MLATPVAVLMNSGSATVILVLLCVDTDVSASMSTETGQACARQASDSIVSGILNLRGLGLYESSIGSNCVRLTSGQVCQRQESDLVQVN